jgi:hypothetical protein
LSMRCRARTCQPSCSSPSVRLATSCNRP